MVRQRPQQRDAPREQAAAGRDVVTGRCDHPERVDHRREERRLGRLLGDRPALLAPALGCVVVGEHPRHRAHVVQLLGERALIA